MRIILMRHGRPELDLDALKHEKLSSRGLGEIVKAYLSTNLHPDTTPPEEANMLAASCALCLTSDMPRAISSARMLGVGDKAKIDPNLREADLPYLNWRHPVLRLSTWTFLFRVFWLFGFSQNAETVKDAKRRALQNAEKLDLLAREYGSVLIVGHGIMNRLIARELTKSGWRKRSGVKAQYWSSLVFENESA